MPIAKIYALENTIGTETVYHRRRLERGVLPPKPEQPQTCKEYLQFKVRKQTEGICAGLSLLWCRKVLDDKNPREAMPSYQQAALLQGLYVRLGWNIEGILEALDLGFEDQREDRGPQIIMEIAQNQDSAVYLLMYPPHGAKPGHGMAVKTGKDGWFFFEPDEGLFHCSSMDDFYELIWEQLYDGMGGLQWRRMKLLKDPQGRRYDIKRPTDRVVPTRDVAVIVEDEPRGAS